MITIPAAVVLVAFIVSTAILIGLMGAGLYHGYRFGRHDPLTMTINTIFLATAIGAIIMTAILLTPVDWSEPFVVGTINLPSLPALDINF